MQSIHVLEVQPIVQKFFRPNSTDYILFLDDGVKCPASSNPFVTDKGNIPVSAICFDCRSFKGFFSDNDQKSVFCEGILDLQAPDTNPGLKDCLEPIEQNLESFWQSSHQSIVLNQSTEKGIS